MTLSLDDVRNKRFRMARKSGYEVLEVDEFVDEVEVAFEQLGEENQNLKKQIEALQATPAVEQAAPVEAGPTEPETIVVTTGAEASSAVVRLVTLSTEQAERLVEEATAEAAEIRASATTAAQEITGDARARADRITAEAQEIAERVHAEAKGRADNLDAEIAGRRAELLDALHAERDDLQVAVGKLRGFEADFRANLTNHLRGHIASLESGTAEPFEVPALAEATAVSAAGQRATDEAGSADESVDSTGAADSTEGAAANDKDESVFPADDPADDADSASTSETPRLDALLGDQR